MHLNKSYCFIFSTFNCYVTTTTHNSHPYILDPTAHPAPHRPMGPGVRVPKGTLFYSAARQTPKKKGERRNVTADKDCLIVELRFLGIVGAVLRPRSHNGYFM